VIHPIFSPTDQNLHSRVRVAILGAGVDSTHPDIRKAAENKSIAECKGFPEHFDPLHDPQNHGTYGISIALRTMPTVSLYIARVVDDDGNLFEENGYHETARVRSLILKALICTGN
jgi:hypothetical protein